MSECLINVTCLSVTLLLANPVYLLPYGLVHIPNCVYKKSSEGAAALVMSHLCSSPFLTFLPLNSSYTSIHSIPPSFHTTFSFPTLHFCSLCFSLLPYLPPSLLPLHLSFFLPLYTSVPYFLSPCTEPSSSIFLLFFPTVYFCSQPSSPLSYLSPSFPAFNFHSLPPSLPTYLFFPSCADVHYVFSHVCIYVCIFAVFLYVYTTYTSWSCMHEDNIWLTVLLFEKLTVSLWVFSWMSLQAYQKIYEAFTPWKANTPLATWMFSAALEKTFAMESWNV